MLPPPFFNTHLELSPRGLSILFCGNRIPVIDKKEFNIRLTALESGKSEAMMLTSGVRPLDGSSHYEEEQHS